MTYSLATIDCMELEEYEMFCIMCQEQDIAHENQRATAKKLSAFLGDDAPKNFELKEEVELPF